MRLVLFTAVTLCLLIVGCSEAPAPGKKAASPHLVEVVSASQINIAVRRERTGSLRAFREIQIFNQEEGRITALPFYEGDQVKSGQLVARLDDRLLNAERNRITAERRKAEKDLMRIRGLAKRKLAAETDLTRAETDLAVLRADEQIINTRLEYTQMQSPINGVISARLTEPGNIAERYTHLLTVSDQSKLITEVQVSELLLNKLHIGDPVTMTIDALSGLDSSAVPLSASITRIHPNLNPLTRTGTVEIALNPVPDGARPGQLARITLQTEKASRLLIPFVGLRRASEGEFVYLVNADNSIETRPVRSGLRIGDSIEILSGLSTGEYVVIRGFTGLRNGLNVSLLNAAGNRQ
ncbi:efflux RND transporter periplasmic adaptor subunit [Pontibacter sp. JAM-7]|uniref:efflux RND transporter periplasmic adaptor subunit n=1 Tax=Pontibacter sp. JAM-7 TaxID=3366581 RepID=UPI003AF82B39